MQICNANGFMLFGPVALGAQTKEDRWLLIGETKTSKAKSQLRYKTPYVLS